MKIKKMLPFFVTAAITLLVAFAAVAFLLRPQILEIGLVDLDTVTDGEYIGICQNKILLAVVKVEVKSVKEIYNKKGYHTENLSHILICGSIPGRPGICNGCKCERNLY